MHNQTDKELTGRVWKFGCNWRGDPRSFYDFIKNEKIVFGRERCPYSIGDLVLITEGFTVKAIAKVLSSRLPITSKPKYKSLEADYSIDYENTTNFAEAEWYELSEKEIFRYQVQRGATRVRNQEIINNAVELWRGRNAK